MTVGTDQEGREPASIVSPAARRLLFFAAVIALFVLAMLAASLAGHPTFTPPVPDSIPRPEPTSVQSPAAPTGTPEQIDEGFGGLVALVVLMLLVLAVVAVIVILLIRMLLRAWRTRPLRQREGTATDVDVQSDVAPEPAPDAPAMRRGIAAARALIDAHADPGDAIVAAWVGLEETAADSGSGRGHSETPAEFTLRILLRRPGIEEPARRLLRLYEGVRFGGHAASEPDRLEAISALSRIEEGWR